MEANITREQAMALLREYNEEPFHIQHALTVEGVLRWYARELGCGADEEFWALAGLLHDIDFERWPEEHCRKAPELLEKAAARRSSSTPSAPTGTASAATWSPPTRWRRSSSRRMS